MPVLVLAYLIKFKTLIKDTETFAFVHRTKVLLLSLLPVVTKSVVNSRRIITQGRLIVNSY